MGMLKYGELIKREEKIKSMQNKAIRERKEKSNAHGEIFTA